MRITSGASRVGCVSMIGACVVCASMAGPGLAQSSRTPSPPNANEYFETPSQGDRLTSPFTVRAGIRGLGVAPSATAVPKTGHHNLLIDTEPGPVDSPLPSTNGIVHLANGETETTVTLSPGWHTLQLVFTDGSDMNFDPPLVSKPIRINVRRH